MGLHSLNYDVGDFDRNEHSENVYVDSLLSSFCSGGLIIMHAVAMWGIYVSRLNTFPDTFLSQRSLHFEPIFRLLLKVAVNGTHQCESRNFCGSLSPNALHNSWWFRMMCFLTSGTLMRGGDRCSPF